MSAIQMKTAVAFSMAENNVRLEGINPHTSTHYEGIKARVITGQISFADAKKEILKRHTAHH